MAEPTGLTLLAQHLGRPIDTACSLLESLLGPSFDTAGLALNDQFQFWQWQNRVRMLEKTLDILAERQVAARVLPPDFIFPALREAGDVCDDDLQAAWANLLASASQDEGAANVSVLYTLKQLAASDARLLRAILVKGPTRFVSDDKNMEFLVREAGITQRQVTEGIANLTRLGIFSQMEGRRLTSFGRIFVESCMAMPQELALYLHQQKLLPVIKGIKSHSLQ